MDAFIIYKASLEEPLNLNYIILKEMADVRNHNTRALPFGALLTQIFLHFHINIDSQPSQGLDKGFSMNTIKKGKNLGLDEKDREEEMIDGGAHDMDVEGGNLDIIPFQPEGIQFEEVRVPQIFKGKKVMRGMRRSM